MNQLSAFPMYCSSPVTISQCRASAGPNDRLMEWPSSSVYESPKRPERGVVKISPHHGSGYSSPWNSSPWNSSRDDSSSAVENISISSQVDFSQTSKGQLKYNKSGDLSFLQELKPALSLRIIEETDAKQAAEAAALSEQQTEQRNVVKNKASHKKSSQATKRALPYGHITSRHLCTTENILIKVKDKTEVRYKDFLAQDAKIKRDADISLERALEELEEEREKQYAPLLNNYNAEGFEIERRRQELQVAHEQLAKIQAAKMEMADQEARLIEEKRKRDLQEKLVAAVRKEQEQVTSCAKEFSKLLSSCRFQQHLARPSIQMLSDTMNQITGKVSSFLTLTQGGGNVELELVHQYVEEGKKLIPVLAQQIETANAKGEEEMKKQQEEERKKQQQQQQQQQSQVATPVDQVDRGHLGDVKGKPDSGKGPMDTQMTDIIKKYLALQELRKSAEKHCALLTDDSKLSQYRFALQKAVSKPLNSINALRASGLRDKLDSLIRLLSGELVEVENKRISIKQHPAAAVFVRNRLATQLLKRSETISLNPEKRSSAFELASVAVGLWSHDKEFGDLFLAHLHLNCPYAVPFYIPKGSESNEDYYKSLGYKYEDGKIEDQNTFLKRMAGYMVLYFAMIISVSPLPGPHPHGLQYAWKWISCILNTDPWPDVTATVIFNFLDMAGHEMMKTYGRQFWKLIHLLNDHYMAKIVSAGGAGGPVSQLQGFVQEALKTRNIKEPKGLLGPEFWRR